MKPVPMPPSGAPDIIARLDGIVTPVAPAAAPGLPAVVTWKGAPTAAPALAATPRNPRRDVFVPISFPVLIENLSNRSRKRFPSRDR
jgi:hypothetical protein